MSYGRRFLLGFAGVLLCWGSLAAVGQDRGRGKDPGQGDKTSTGLVPLSELTGTYKGEDGGLYGGGKNAPPEAHRAAAEKETAEVVPRDGEGKPSADGTIVLVSIS